MLFVVLALQLFNQRVSSPSFYLSWRGLIIILLSAAFAFLDAFNFNYAYSSFKDIVIPFVLIIIVYNYPGNNFKLLRIFNVVVKILTLVCLASAFSFMTGAFDMVSPEPWSNKFSNSGFGGYRTGWSNSLFLVVPFSVFYAKKFHKKSTIYWGFLTVLSVIFIQFISGGRAGLLASFLSLILFSIKDFKFTILLSIAVFIVYFYLPKELFFEQLRISENKDLAQYDQDELDETSSFRLDGYIFGYALFKEQPILGYGFGQSEELTNKLGYDFDIHNVWLKRLVEGGLIFVLPLLYLFIHIFRQVSRKYNSESIEKKFFVALVIPGLLISFLEPNYMIGSVQGEAFFWGSVALILRNDN